MVYTFTTLFTYYECLYLQKNTDIPNHFCVELTPISFLFPVAPRHVDSKTDQLAPSKHVKSGYSWPARKTPPEKRFAGGPIVARDLVLAVCKLAPGS